MMKIDKNRYSEIKNLAYFTYDIYSKSSPDKAESLLESCLEKYETEEEKKIFRNTLLCPFDIELINDLFYVKATDDNIFPIMQEFNLTPELLREKMYEYTFCQFVNCVGENLIKYNLIHQLSIQKQNNVVESGKNT